MLCDNQPQILTVGDFFLSKEYQALELPPYQRPYEWTPRHVQTLLEDLLDFQKKEETHRYRLGSIILCNNKENNLEVVDGQQRLVTLWLIRTCLRSDHSPAHSAVPNDAIGNFSLNNDISQNAVRNAFVAIEDWLNNHTSDVKNNLLAMLTDSSGQSKSVELVIIKVSNREEAFQLFDSQSRGKPLGIHNYLKARHLGCMSSEELWSANKYGLFDGWKDDKDADAIEMLLNRLFKIIEWSHRRTRTQLTIENMDHFFYGFTDSNYTYQRFYHPQFVYFEIGHPFKAGAEFFWMIDYFRALSQRIDDYYFDSTPSSGKAIAFRKGRPLEKYTKLFTEDLEKQKKPNDNSGVWTEAELTRCLELFRTVALLYSNRFGFDHLSQDNVAKTLFDWTLAPRYVFIRLRDETIEDFASGIWNNNSNNWQRGLKEINYFEQISENLTTDFLYELEQALPAVIEFRSNPKTKYSDRNDSKRNRIECISINK